MSDTVLFYMDESYRQHLIEKHLFYVEQAKKRLLAQFSDLDGEADKAAMQWLEQSNEWFDPDRHDPGDFYERANEVGLEFYELIRDMRDQTRLSVVAGMFHEWDKKLREWLVREIRHWRDGDNVSNKVWAVDFDKIMELLEALGWKIRNTACFYQLDACRLLVNVYKHGNGKSFDDLKCKYPDYLDKRLSGLLGDGWQEHTDITVSEDQIQGFSDAIMAFWRDVPERIYNSDSVCAPSWFEKAFLKDRRSDQQGNSP